MPESATPTTEPAASSCCAPAVQESCCEPSAKSECCGTEATADGSCGCSAGQTDAALAGDELQETVRAKYAAAASAVLEQGASACCSDAGVITDEQRAVFGEGLYGDDHAELPGAAVLASLGCGNPTAIAALEEGETVLDLGSGGGIDVLLSAKRVGPTGKAYGLDMTDEMLDLARANQAEAGVTNVEFLKGTIEQVPLPDATIDVIISNCVINLSGDKPQVLHEAARVLSPGGRFAVSDVIADDNMTDETRADMQQWTGAQLRRAGGEPVELTLADDGAHGDGAAGDGTYAATTAPLPDGGYVVLATAAGRRDGVAFRRTAIGEADVRQGTVDPEDPGDGPVDPGPGPVDPVPGPVDPGPGAGGPGPVAPGPVAPGPVPGGGAPPAGGGVTIVSAKVARPGRVAVRPRCAAGNVHCAGTLELETAAKLRRGKRRARLALGKARFALGASRTATVTVRLSAAGRRLLRPGRTLKLRLTAAPTTGADGRPRSAVRTLKLRAPKAKRTRR